MKTLISLLALAFSLQGLAAIFEPLTKWGHPEVRVCFLESVEYLKGKVDSDFYSDVKIIPFSESEKELITQTINREYSQDLTGIYFTGWENCEDRLPADAVISKAYKGFKFLGNYWTGPTYSGRSTIGHAGVLKDKSYISTDHLSLVTLVDADVYTIAHEFGHLAGLRHEHIRKEAGLDPECKSTYKKSYENFYDSTEVLTEYDPESIMNYCYLFQVTKERQELLSPLDREALRKEYKH